MWYACIYVWAQELHVALLGQLSEGGFIVFEKRWLWYLN